jgi:hypothetical protein
MQKPRGFLLSLLTVLFMLTFQLHAQARGASMSGAGEGPAPSPAANPDSPGAGPHSGPPATTYNPFTGVFTLGDAPPPDGSKKLFGNLSWPDTQVDSTVDSKNHN